MAVWSVKWLPNPGLARMAARSSADFGLAEGCWLNSTPWAVWVMVPPRSAAPGSALNGKAAFGDSRQAYARCLRPRRGLESGGDGVAHGTRGACTAVALFDVGDHCRFDP